MLQRFPDGATGKSFYQKRIPAGAPEWLESTTVSTPNGTTSNALVVADIAHVVWAVNIGCLGLHLWPYLAADPAHADELRIDLDPTTGIGFDEVRAVALLCRDVLEELGLRGYPKTTGNNGLHVYLRLEARWDSVQVRAAAVALARELERRFPDLITANWWKEERGQPRLRRLQPERAAQDRLRRLVRPAPHGRAGLDAPHLAGGRDGGARRSDHPQRARPGAPPRRPVGGHRHRDRSRSSPCSRWPRATGRPACTTHRGRRSTPRCPTNRPAWPRAGRRRPDAVEPLDALNRIAFRLERGGADTYKVRAFRHAARAVAGVDARAASARWPRPGGCRASRASGSPRPRSSPRPSTARCPTVLTKLEETPDDLELDGAGGGSSWAPSAATATPTPTGPTAAAPSTKWPRRRATSATSTWC